MRNGACLYLNVITSFTGSQPDGHQMIGMVSKQPVENFFFE